GGKLINRTLPKGRITELLKKKEKLAHIVVNESTLKDIFNICHGVFSPLEGFLCKEDYESVINTMRLPDDIPWTIPIVLDVSSDFSNRLKKGEDIFLDWPKGEPVAVLHLKEKYSYDKEEMAEQVFGTCDQAHPGVEKVKKMKPVLLGGKIDLIKNPSLPFTNYTLKPVETRFLFKEKGWREIAGFQTRNIPHLGHEYVQKTALTFTDGLFINPVIGRKKKGDFTDEVILASYNVLIKHYYLKQRAVMGVLQLEMRYAGPKEAVLHAIVRKNFGCTHFIVGRDHAGVGNFYHPFAAHEIFEEFPDLGIIPLFFKTFYRCKKCDAIVNDKICPHSGEYHINFSGTEIRKLLSEGKIPPSELMRPEVSKAVIDFKDIFVK
ncbi:MAG: sulfate adenylyltransferase, partial [Candidatus Omnitrophota bacterium]|nr:sulfate adenylyltransferase [Candidatus Omnitrophota bacterium]